MAPSVNTDEQEVVGEIVTRVAEREGTAPENLQPLYHVIETDALERLFRDTQGTVTFAYLGYEITVTHDQDTRVAVRELAGAASTT